MKTQTIRMAKSKVAKLTLKPNFIGGYAVYFDSKHRSFISQGKDTKTLDEALLLFTEWKDEINNYYLGCPDLCLKER